MVVLACTDRVEEEHTADGKDSGHTDRRIEDEPHNRSVDNMGVGVRHADIPDSQSEMAFLDAVAYGVACDDLVAAEEVPGDGEQLRSVVERVIRRCVVDSGDRELTGLKSAQVEHGDEEVGALEQQKPVVEQSEQQTVELPVLVPE